MINPPSVMVDGFGVVDGFVEASTSFLTSRRSVGSGGQKPTGQLCHASYGSVL